MACGGAAPAPEEMEVPKPSDVGRQPPERGSNPGARPGVPGSVEKLRNLFGGAVGNGPEAQKSQALSRGQLRQGEGFQVQNRLGQTGQRFSLTSLVNDAAGGDQTAGDRGKPRLLQSGTEARQGPGRSRLRTRLEFPGVGAIMPEGLSQDQIPGRQPRGQGAPEPDGDQELGAAAPHQGLPGTAGRSRSHPGQGHHRTSRLPVPGRQPQIPASLSFDLAQKRPHFQGKCSHDENPAGKGGAGGVPARRCRRHQGLGIGRWSGLGGSGAYNSFWPGAAPTCLGPRQRRPLTRRLPFLWITVWSSRIIKPCLAEISE